MAAKRPTLAKVAALAGVSVSQASDALRGGGRVSAKTQERVRAAAAQLGYQTQTVARVLREGMTDFVAVVADRQTTNAPDGSLYPFWSKFLTAFTVTIREYGYAVILDFDSSTHEIKKLPAQAVLSLTSDASRVASLRGGGFGQVIALSPDADPATVVDPGAHAVILQHNYPAIGTEVADFLAGRDRRHLLVLERPGTHWYMTQIGAAVRDAAVSRDLNVTSLAPAPQSGSDQTTLDAVRAAVAEVDTVDAILDFTGVTAALEAVLAEQGRGITPDGRDGSVVVVTQSEGTGAGIDPCVHYLSFEGRECGEIIGEHFVALLYGRRLEPPQLPHRLRVASG